VTILRIWRGFTTPEKADAYETLLRSSHFPNIAAKRIPGFRRIELVKRREGDRGRCASSCASTPSRR
jgi:hypothetical protein